MADEHACRRVLAAYGADCQPLRIEPLASAGGFSGARFWRVSAQAGVLCLRRWPREHPDRQQLEFIQAVLWHVHQEGFGLVPLPLETRTLAGYVCEAGHLWELTPWLPGEADYHRSPSLARLRAAATALAGFHQAAASFPLPHRGPGTAPGLRSRLKRLEVWNDARLVQVSAAITAGDWPEMAERARRLVPLFARAAEAVADVLRQALPIQASLEPCIRDIWHDHVLFVGDEVSGLIDFGALRVDSVATDVARLLGSLCGDDSAAWLEALNAYDSVRPLSSGEALLVTAFDRSNVLLSGMSWLEWIYLEGREFENRAAICERLDANLARLEHLVGQTAFGV
ncbi:MAG TPA: aminoglycoside phosphotransferase family protein [Pirellulales bacterium]|nr:aminoglycoside phosphotransferase family protein [Pirellulales bacterium]